MPGLAVEICWNRSQWCSAAIQGAVIIGGKVKIGNRYKVWHHTYRVGIAGRTCFPFCKSPGHACTPLPYRVRISGEDVIIVRIPTGGRCSGDITYGEMRTGSSCSAIIEDVIPERMV